MSEYEHEVRDLAEQMKGLAVKSAVLVARDAVNDVGGHVDFQIDLRSFLAGMISSQVMGQPDAVGHILGLFEPEIARTELESAAADVDHFKDLPVYEPGS